MLYIFKYSINNTYSNKYKGLGNLFKLNFKHIKNNVQM